MFRCKVMAFRVLDFYIGLLEQFNKAVLEPSVSPAFAITYFCNHCNIRFENTCMCGYTDPFFQKLEPKVIDP